MNTTPTSTAMNSDLARFLATDDGRLAVACFVGCRSWHGLEMVQAEEAALEYMPRKDRRSWTVSDLMAAALQVLPSGLYAANEPI